VIRLFSPEIQLLLVAGFFFFYEASILIYENEAILMPDGRKEWDVKIGPKGFKLSNKYLFFSNILLLHRPVYRLTWDPKNLDIEVKPELTGATTKFSEFNYVVYGAAITIFIILPVALLFNPTPVTLLTTTLGIYLNSACAAWLLLRRSGQIKFGLKLARKTAIECLLCPPITLNLVRRLSTSDSLKTSALAACYRYCDELDWEQSKAHFLDLLNQSIEIENENEIESLVTARTFVSNLIQNENI